MTTAWKVYIDWNQDNDFSDTYEEIFSDVQEMQFRLGMYQAFQNVASESQTYIVVRNIDGKYNPDNTSSPLYGYLYPYRPVKITANDGGGEQTMWRGWIESVIPEWRPAGAYTGTTTALIRCIGLKDILEITPVLLPLQEGKYGHEIVNLMLTYVNLPPATAFGWLLGVPGRSEVGESTWLAGATDYSSVESGAVLFNYYGDIQNDDIEKPPPTGYDIIRDVTDAERGFFFFSREGKAVWWNQDHFFDDVTDDYIIDSSGALGTKPQSLSPGGMYIVNDVEVTGFQRDLQNSVTLWSLDAEMTIAPGETREFDAPYTDEFRNRAGAKDVTTSGVTFSSGTATITVSEGADRAEVIIENTGSVNAVLTALNLVGTIIRARRPLTVHLYDADSIRLYGRRAEIKLRLRALDDYDQIRVIAEYELFQHKEPRFDITQARFINAALDWTIGDRIRIIDAGLGHDAPYFIVGEQHQIADSGKTHTIDFTFRPATITRLGAAPLRFYDTEFALMDADAVPYLAQAFTPIVAKDMVKGRLRLRKVGSPTGSMTLKLFADKSYSNQWLLGETGFSELGVTTQLVPEDNKTVPYDYDTEPTFVDAGTVSQGTTFTHAADCEIYFEVDTLPSNPNATLIDFRMQDTNNLWRAFIFYNGSIQFYEYVAGSPTLRANPLPGTVSNGSIIRVICNDETIDMYVDDGLEINYTSAANFKTETDGRLVVVGAGGVVKDLVANRYAPAAVAATATSDTVDADDLLTYYTWIDFAFSTPPSLSADTTYWIRLETDDAADANNYIEWAAASEPYIVGLQAYWDMSADGSDSHHHGKNLTNNGSIAFNDDGYAEFDSATPKYFSLADDAEFHPQTNDFAMTFDIRITGSANLLQYIIQKTDLSTDHAFSLKLENRTLTFAASDDGSALTSVSSSVTINPHEDYRIILWRTYDWLAGTGTIGISVNDTENTTAFNDELWTDSNALEIGSFDGWMRRFAFWNGFAPSSTQRDWIYANLPTYNLLNRYSGGDMQFRITDGWRREYADSIFEVLA